MEGPALDAAPSRTTRQALAVWQRINSLLSTTLDLGAVLRCILTELVALFTAPSTLVILHEEDAQEAKLLTTYGAASVFLTLRYPWQGPSPVGSPSINAPSRWRASRRTSRAGA